MPDRVIIARNITTGGREFEDSDRIEADQRVQAERLGLRRVAQGGARGADRIAMQSWRVVGPDFTLDSEATYHPEPVDGPWPAAGCRRNERMIDREIELAAAVDARLIVTAYPDPKSVGTWHAIRYALGRGLPVLVWTGAIVDAVERIARYERQPDPFGVDWIRTKHVLVARWTADNASVHDAIITAFQEAA